MKARELTQLQWEFIMTAWRQSRNFGEMRQRSRKYFQIGTKVFYHLRGKHVHGPAFKWPAMRFAGESEDKLSEHLYLDWDHEPNNKATPPRLIQKHRGQTLDELSTINNQQPFHIYGTSRVRDSAGLSHPFDVIVNDATGEAGTESPIRGPGPALVQVSREAQAETVAGD